MFYYILFGTSMYFILYNWQTILWSVFYYYSYIQYFIKSQLCIENENKNNNDSLYLGILKSDKTVVKYDFSKEDDYLFYYCTNYKSCDLKTNYKFIAVTLNILYGNKKDTHHICLEDDNDTFYLENNILLNSWFVEWYCLSYKHITLPKDFTYNITLIDNVANIQTISKNQYIKLNKLFYEIKNID